MAQGERDVPLREVGGSILGLPGPSVLGQDNESQVALSDQASTSHGSCRHQCVSVCVREAVVKHFG